MIHIPHVRVVADAAPASSPSTRPTIPAPVDPAVAHLDQIIRTVITFAGTYAPGNVAARQMAESVAQELRRLAVAAGVPGGECVGASIVPLMPTATAATTATASQGGE